MAAQIAAGIAPDISRYFDTDYPSYDVAEIAFQIVGSLITLENERQQRELAKAMRTQ